MLLHAKMNERGVSIRQLADEVGVVYETVRKAVGGIQLPSKRLLRDIANFLKIDPKHAEELRVQEQLTAKYGDAAARLSRKNPELIQIDQFWDFLTAEQKQHITWLVQSLADKNAGRRPSLPSAERPKTLRLVPSSKSNSGQRSKNDGSLTAMIPRVKRLNAKKRRRAEPS